MKLLKKHRTAFIIPKTNHNKPQIIFINKNKNNNNIKKLNKILITIPKSAKINKATQLSKTVKERQIILILQTQ